MHENSDSTLNTALLDAANRAAADADRSRHLLQKNPGVIVFGAGGLGRSVLRGLREHNVDVRAFSDNDPRRQHQVVDGLPVLTPEKAIAEFGSDALFVAAVWNAGRHRNQVDIRAQLRALGGKNVLSFTDVFRHFPETFLPYFAVDRYENVLNARSSIESAYHLLADETSRRIFREQLLWRVTADYATLGSPRDEPQYFPEDVYRLTDDETFVDCGAYDGDTLRQFLMLTSGRFSRYWALEPDDENRAKLTAFIDGLPADVAGRVDCLSVAASDRRGQERFDSRGSASSSLNEQGTVVIQCAPLDELVDTCTIIKADVEGAEPKILEGSHRLIRECAPVLALSAYHAQSHLWELPLTVAAMNSSYQLFYREHNEEAFDMVLYAVSPERRR